MIDLPIYAEVVWDRGGSMALNCKRFAPSHEGIWAFGRPHYWDDSNNMKMSVWRISAARDKHGHPCPFPVDLVAPLIESSCPRDGTILDPFCGSGTTGVACMNTGRNFIGFEIDAGYCEIARKRIGEAASKHALLETANV
jgi:DNA modification methylase